MDVRKSGFFMVKANIFVALILKGVIVVSVCWDKAIRAETQAYFGFDIRWAGIVGILLGGAIIAGIGQYERTGRVFK